MCPLRNIQPLRTDRLHLNLQLLYRSVPPLVFSILPLPPPLILPLCAPQRPQKIQCRKKSLYSPRPGYRILPTDVISYNGSLVKVVRDYRQKAIFYPEAIVCFHHIFSGFLKR